MSPSYYYIKLYLVPTPLIGDQIVAFSLAGPMTDRLVVVHNKFCNQDERCVNMMSNGKFTTRTFRYSEIIKTT